MEDIQDVAVGVFRHLNQNAFRTAPNGYSVPHAAKLTSEVLHVSHLPSAIAVGISQENMQRAL
jgi:hypothetical protein